MSGATTVDVERDREHVRLLAIFHGIAAGLGVLVSLFPLIHFAIGLGLVSGELGSPSDAGEAEVVGWFFVLFSVAMILAGLALSAAIALAGWYLSQLRARTYCLVIAGLACVFVPIGTVLGVFTIVVLSRPSVVALFAGSRDAKAPR